MLSMSRLATGDNSKLPEGVLCENKPGVISWCVCVGPDGKAVRSKYDPFHALLQRAQEDPSWPSEGPGFDPLAAAFQVSLVPLVTGAACSYLAVLLSSFF